MLALGADPCLRVKVHVNGRETEDVVTSETPLHKKNPEIGMKKTVYASNVIVEQEDAVSFGDNEEVRFRSRAR